MDRSSCLLVLWALLILSLTSLSLCCNEAVCASIVSKCMLTQSCKCDLKNSTCGRECSLCLGDLYTECCSCVEMCPKPIETESKLSQKSHVEELQEPMADLFGILTEEKDRLLRWVSYSYPSHLSFISGANEKDLIVDGKSSSGEEVAVNCTVAFMSQCMSWNKCKNSCLSMGASSYRWFHDGCCQCVGSTCINYGISESRCLKCSNNEDTSEEDSYRGKGDDILEENSKDEPLHNSADEYLKIESF